MIYLGCTGPGDPALNRRSRRSGAWAIYCSPSSEIDLRIRAREYGEALELTALIDDCYLRGWGQSNALLDWRRRLRMASGRHHRCSTAPLALAASVAMVPWTAGLATRLPHRDVAAHWNLTWGRVRGAGVGQLRCHGMDCVRRGPAAVPATAVTITLLRCDAWFDLTTASTMSDVVTSAVTAVAGELPLAALLGFLVRGAHRILACR